MDQFVPAILYWRSHKDCALRRVVRQGSRRNPGAAMLFQRKNWGRFDILHKIIAPDLLLFRDIKHLILVYRRCGALALKFKDHNTSIVAGRKQVDLGMGSNHPESIQ